MAVDVGERLARDASARRLPIPYVLHREEIALEPAPGGRLRGACPFHQDENPSLDVWGENWEWWGCFPCGLTGDVVQLVKRLDERHLGRTLSYEQAVERADKYHRQMVAEGWKADLGWTPRKRKEFGKEHAERRVELARDNLDALWSFIRYRGWPDGMVSTLRVLWQVGGEGDRLLIPHYGPRHGPDRRGDLTGMKNRLPGEPTWAIPGSRFLYLYGAWKDSRGPNVVIVEGESDAWRLSHWAYDDMVSGRRQSEPFDVLALPTGSGSPITDEMIQQVQGRRITLAFDADRAGLQARDRWLKVLDEQAFPSVLDYVELPEGKDVDDVRGAIWDYPVRRVV